MSADLRLEAGVDPAAHVRAWVDTPQLAELVAAFGGDAALLQGETAAVLERLGAFSERWDFRRGRERSEDVDARFDDRQLAAIEGAVRPLGQLDTRLPERRDWDRIVMLGGMLRACISRPQFVANALARGDLRTRTLVALGAFRRIENPSELELGEALLETLPAHELDAMELGVRRAFALEDLLEARGQRHPAVEASWEERTLRRRDGTLFEVLAAPSTTPGRRANTLRALEWLGETRPPAPGEAILIVTTEIYRHRQLVDALRALGKPYGAVVDAVGITPGDVDPRLAHRFRPHTRAQEFRSSIGGLRRIAAQAST